MRLEVARLVTPLCWSVGLSSLPTAHAHLRADEPTIYDPITGKFSAKGSLNMAARGRG